MVDTTKFIDPPPPEQTPYASIMPTDASLESVFALPVHATHYVGQLAGPAQSQGARKHPYLPVRLAPHSYSPALKLGWDDRGYHLLNNEGQLVTDQHGNDASNGIEVNVGTGVFVTEIVQSDTGLWVGFVIEDTDISTELITKWTSNWTQILYTRPEYLRARTGGLVGTNLIPFSNTFYGVARGADAKIADAAKAIAPGKNDNWEKIENNDVIMSYFNFTEYNKERLGDKLKISTGLIKQDPRLRYSEGYYYFVVTEGVRKNAAQLYTQEMIDSGVVLSSEAQAQLLSAKESERLLTEDNIKKVAVDVLLEYHNKDVNRIETRAALQGSGLDPGLLVSVAKKLKVQGPNPNNQKILFAAPASVIDGAMDTNNPYNDNFSKSEETSALNLLDPYEEFRTSGSKDYVFTISLKELRNTCKEIAALFDKFKKQVESFESSGGIIKNPNHVSYDVDSQIKSIETFPDVIDRFLRKQPFPSTSDQENLAMAHFPPATDTEHDHILQIGLRDNGKVGGDVRNTISFIVFSPDPEDLKTWESDELYQIDPNISQDEIQGELPVRRSGYVLKKGMNWLRNQFVGIEASRTLHYIMSYKNLLTYGSEAKKEGKTDKWIKFLQAYSVPPFLIWTTKDPTHQPGEDVDCEELVKKLKEMPAVMNEEQKRFEEEVLSKCRKYIASQRKNTSAADQRVQKKNLQDGYLAAESAAGSETIDALKYLYKIFLHELDVPTLMELLMACIQSKIGMDLTAEALCEAAMIKMVEQVGVEKFKGTLLKFMPELAPYFSGGDSYVDSVIGEDAAKILKDLEENNATPSNKGTNTADAPWMFTVDSLDEGWRLDSRFDGAPVATGLVLGGSAPPHVVHAVMSLEKGGTGVELVPGPRKPHEVLPSGNTQASEVWDALLKAGSEFSQLVEGGDFYSWAEINELRKSYISQGHTRKSADALLVEQGYLVPRTVEYGSAIDTFSDAMEKFSDSMNYHGAGATADAFRTAGSALAQAKYFVKYLGSITDIRQACENIVGPLLELPQMLLAESDPSQFDELFSEWGSDFVNRFSKQFTPKIPKLKLPDSLPVGYPMDQYTKMVLKAVIAILAAVLGKLLHLFLLDLINTCFEEDPSEGEGPTFGAPTVPPDVIPLADLRQRARLGPTTAPLEIARYLQDLISSCSPAQLCALMKGTASTQLSQSLVERTRQHWPNIYAAGIGDSVPDINKIFKDIGEDFNLDICNFLNAKPNVDVDACQNAIFDYDERCNELQQAGLTPEECQEHISQELESLKNKILGLADWTLPGQPTTFQQAVPEPCGPDGYFQLPSATKDSMARVTDTILDYTKINLLSDLDNMQFFLMPPRAIQAIQSPDQLDEAHQIMVDALHTNKPLSPLVLVPGNKYFGGSTFSGRNEDQSGYAFDGSEHQGRGYNLFYGNHRMSAGDYAAGGGHSYNSYRSPERSGTEYWQKDPTFGDTNNPSFLKIDYLFAGAHLGGLTNSTAGQNRIRDDIRRMWENKDEVIYPTAEGAPERTLGQFLTTWGIETTWGTAINGGTWKNPTSPDQTFYKNDLTAAKYQQVVIKNISFGDGPADANGMPVPPSPNAVDFVYTFDLWRFFVKMKGELSTFTKSGKQNGPFGLPEAVNTYGQDIFTKVWPLDTKLKDIYPGIHPTKITHRPNNGVATSRWALGWHGMFSRFIGIGGMKGDTVADKWDDEDLTGNIDLERFKQGANGAFGINPIAYITMEHDEASLGVSGTNFGDRKSYDLLGVPWSEDLFDEGYDTLDNRPVVHSKSGDRFWSDGLIFLLEKLKSYPVGTHLMEVFMDLTVAEATGLTHERISRLYPNWPSINTLVGGTGGVVFANHHSYPADKDHESWRQLSSDDEARGGFGPWHQGIKPMFIAFEVPFRNLDSPLEDAQGVLDTMTMDNQPINKQLYEYLNVINDGDDLFQKSLGFKKSPGRTDIQQDAARIERNHNFNPNILSYPMNYTSFLGSSTQSKELLASNAITEIFSSPSISGQPSFDAIASLADELSATQLDRMLIYQNRLVPKEKTYNQLLGSLRDDSMLVKGKIAPDDSAYGKNEGNSSYSSYPIRFSEKIRDSIYNFDLLGSKLDADVLELLDSMSLSNSEMVHDSNKELYNSYLYGDSSWAQQGKHYDDIIPAGMPHHTAVGQGSKIHKSLWWPTTDPADIGLFDSPLSYAKENYNFKAHIFGKFLTEKLFQFIDNHPPIDGDDQDNPKYIRNPTEMTVGKNTFKNRIMYLLSTHGYSALQYAYSSRAFSKVANSRLHKRKHMKMLWKAILKTPLNTSIDPRCTTKFKQLGITPAPGEGEIETDFWNIEAVKTSILEYYEKSVCRDIYDGQANAINATQRSLLEGALQMLVRIYVLEVCLAGVVTWEAFDIGDLFKEKIMKQVVVAHMQEEIGADQFDFFVQFFDSALKKKENIDVLVKYLSDNNISSLEYVIEKEAESIGSIISTLFTNPSVKPLSTGMSLKTVNARSPDLSETLADMYDQPLFQSSNFNFYNSNKENIFNTLHGSGGDYDDAPYTQRNDFDENFLKPVEDANNRGEYWGAKRRATALKIGQNAAAASSNPWNSDYVVDVNLTNNIYTLCNNNNNFYAPYYDASDAVALDGNIFGNGTLDLNQTNYFQSIPYGYYGKESNDKSGLPFGDFRSLGPWDHQKGKYNFNHPDFNHPGELYAKTLQHVDKFRLAGSESDIDGLGVSQDRPIMEPYNLTFDGEGTSGGFSWDDYSDGGDWHKVKSIQKAHRAISSDPFAFEQCPHLTFRNNLNAKVGNILFQTYVFIEDADASDRENIYITVDEETVSCSPTPGGTPLTDILGSDPFLDFARRGRTNLPGRDGTAEDRQGDRGNASPKPRTGPHIFGYVPIPVWSHFYNHIVMPVINSNSVYKAVFQKYGLSPFFRKIKYGIRMTYTCHYPVIPRGKGYSTDTDYSYDPIQEVDFKLDEDGEETAQWNPAVDHGDVNYVHNMAKLCGQDVLERTKSILQTAPYVLHADEDSDQLDGTSVIPMMHEMHIPIHQVEKEIILTPNGVHLEDGLRVPYLSVDGKATAYGHMPGVKMFGSAPFQFVSPISEFQSSATKGHQQTLIKTPAQFFYRFVAQDLLQEMQNSAEFKLMFDYLFPQRRYMALAFLFSSDLLIKWIPDQKNLLKKTKRGLMQSIEGIIAAQDGTYQPPFNPIAADMIANQTGTRGLDVPEEEIDILKIILRTPLLILKGFVEITDPAIMIAKLIIDIANAIQQAVVMAIESGVNMAIQGLDGSIMAAEQAKVTMTTQMAIGGSAMQGAAAMLPEEVSAGVKVETDSPNAANWVFEVNQDEMDDEIFPLPEDEQAALDNISQSAQDMTTLVQAFKDLDESLDALREQKKDLEDYRDGELADAKDELNKTLQSPYALPSLWAAMMPSWVPYYGGLPPVNPLITGWGPPGTIPGYIYLALLLMDIWEDKLHDDITNAKNGPNCEEVL